VRAQLCVVKHHCCVCGISSLGVLASGDGSCRNCTIAHKGCDVF
jgi:hypothetical protein